MREARANSNRAADATDRETAFDAETERWWAQFDTDERKRLVAEFREK